MKGFVRGGRSASLANTPLAETRLNCPFLDLNIISTLQSATNRITTNSVLKESDDLVPVGLEIDLLSGHIVTIVDLGGVGWKKRGGRLGDEWEITRGAPERVEDGGRRSICGMPPEVIRARVGRVHTEYSSKLYIRSYISVFK